MYTLLLYYLLCFVIFSIFVLIFVLISTSCSCPWAHSRFLKGFFGHPFDQFGIPWVAMEVAFCRLMVYNGDIPYGDIE